MTNSMKKARQKYNKSEKYQKAKENRIKSNAVLAMKLKKLRSEKGLSLREAAKEIGVNYRSIFNWEEGSCKPSKDNLNKLEKLYEMEMSK